MIGKAGKRAYSVEICTNGGLGLGSIWSDGIRNAFGAAPYRLGHWRSGSGGEHGAVDASYSMVWLEGASLEAKERVADTTCTTLGAVRPICRSAVGCPA